MAVGTCLSPPRSAQKENCTKRKLGFGVAWGQKLLWVPETEHLALSLLTLSPSRWRTAQSALPAPASRLSPAPERRGLAGSAGTQLGDAPSVQLYHNTMCAEFIVHTPSSYQVQDTWWKMKNKINFENCMVLKYGAQQCWPNGFSFNNG